jgi:FkbM family methyltransferase
VRLSGIGLEVSADFPLFGRIVLKLLSGVPPAIREPLAFGGLRRQALLQRIIGGPRMLAVRYTRGPLAGLGFNCYSAEKYFLVGADFESFLLPAICDSVTKASIVYDIGANAGYWSLAFARLCPAGAVYAFEPSPTNYARLVAATLPAPNVHTMRAAVSNENGTVAFSESGTTSRIHDGGDIQVPRVKLDDLNLPAPDLLKIDIEGHAGAALAGAINLLRRVRPVILCEIHDNEENEALGRVIRNLGYTATVVERSHRFPFHVLARHPAHHA